MGGLRVEEQRMWLTRILHLLHNISTLSTLYTVPLPLVTGAGGDHGEGGGGVGVRPRVQVQVLPSILPADGRHRRASQLGGTYTLYTLVPLIPPPTCVPEK